MTAPPPILEAVGLKKSYPAGGDGRDRRRRVLALRGVDLAVGAGETLSITGESGCGKTTLLRTVLRLERPEAGRITFAGNDLTQLPERLLKPFRRRMQIIWQDAAAALDPRQTIGAAIAEPLRLHRLAARPEIKRRVAELLDQVGLPTRDAEAYPHELSGGQCQRAAIARALALNPEFLAADEPTSALDLSVRNQVLNLLFALQARHGLALLLVSHDLTAVRAAGGQTAIMYLGRIVEQGAVEEVFRSPRHPYAHALLAVRPGSSAGAAAQSSRLPGEAPSPLAPPPGCSFHPRCFRAQAICRNVEPALEEKQGRWAACHFPLD